MNIKALAIKALTAPSLKDFIINLLPGQEKDELGYGSSAGIHVSEQTALSIITVYACVRILSETLASLPLILYRRLGRGKERAVDHELYRILHDQPNPEMNSFNFRETLMSHAVLWGNGYAQIDWEDNTRIRGLWLLLPDRMQVRRNRETRQIEYTYHPSDGRGPVTLPAYRVLHIPGLGFDGLTGYSPIALARHDLGLSIATRRYGSKFFKNGAHATGVLEVPGKLSDISYKNLKESFKEESTGLDNAHKPLILEQGMKWNEISISPEDAQFLQTRQFQRGEIASFFHVPPHMVGDLERATFSNIEQQSLEFVIYTMRPWLVRWEQALNSKLLTPAEQPDHFTEFLIDGLLRGDLASRYQAYSVGRNWGWLSANDVCEMENRNGIGAQGDVYMAPANMLPAADFQNQTPKPAAPSVIIPPK